MPSGRGARDDAIGVPASPAASSPAWSWEVPTRRTFGTCRHFATMAAMRNRQPPYLRSPLAWSLWLLLLGLPIGGCSSTPAPQSHAGQVRLAHGTVRIISINAYLKTAVVHYHGRVRNAWWNRYSILFFHGEASSQMDVKPGQHAEFRGLLADGDVYFGRVWRGAPPPPEVYPNAQIVHPAGTQPKKNMKITKRPASGVPAVPGLSQYLREHLKQ